MKTTQPKIDLDATQARLQRLGLDHAAERLSNFVSDAIKHETSAGAFLDQLLDAELQHRDERRIRTSLRLSGLPNGLTLGNFDFAFQPSIERSKIDALATCAWLRAKETLLIQGPPGVGKTHLAVSLGVKAIENGFSVLFHRLDELLALMRKDADLPPTRLRRRKYLNVALLVIDEMGFENMNRLDASLFFRLVAYRYERGSILITTNKGIRDWPELLAGDEILATAILDRLLHRSHVLNVKGRSYRLRDLEMEVSLRA